MTEDEFRQFVDTVAAMTLANNAMIACALAGAKPTPENVIPIVGRVLDQSNPHFERLVLAVEKQRELTVEAANSLVLDKRRT